MSIPVGDREYLEAAEATALSEDPEGRCGWTSLEPAAKRERLLSAAFDVFARDGLDAPMSEVAEAAGAGVASVYRCFASKHDLLAALVTRRMDQIVEAAQESSARGGARMVVADHPDVIASTTRATDAMERLLGAARAEGRLRADASALDLRLVFAATRAAKQVEPEQWPRMLELLIDALRSRDGQ
jgi:AcrR family transcriptional regulator